MKLLVILFLLLPFSFINAAELLLKHADKVECRTFSIDSKRSRVVGDGLEIRYNGERVYRSTPSIDRNAAFELWVQCNDLKSVAYENLSSISIDEASGVLSVVSACR